MKVGDYRDSEIPWRITTQRERKAQEILCEGRKDCPNTAIIYKKNGKRWRRCHDCSKTRL